MVDHLAQMAAADRGRHGNDGIANLVPAERETALSTPCKRVGMYADVCGDALLLFRHKLHSQLGCAGLVCHHVDGAKSEFCLLIRARFVTVLLLHRHMSTPARAPLACPRCGDALLSERDSAAVQCAGCSLCLRTMVCPHCSQPHVLPATSTAKTSLHCTSCNAGLRVLSCPFCRHTNVFDQFAYAEGLQCVCHNCDRAYHHTACSECGHSAYWQGGEWHQGLLQTCDACHHAQYILHCPECGQTSHKTRSEYCDGTPVTCTRCMHTYTQVVCPHCRTANQWSEQGYRPTEVHTCVECSRAFQQAPCLHCHQSNVWTDSLYVPESVVHCQHCACEMSFDVRGMH